MTRVTRLRCARLHSRQLQLTPTLINTLIGLITTFYIHSTFHSMFHSTFHSIPRSAFYMQPCLHSLLLQCISYKKDSKLFVPSHTKSYEKRVVHSVHIIEQNHLDFNIVYCDVGMSLFDIHKAQPTHRTLTDQQINRSLQSIALFTLGV